VPPLGPDYKADEDREVLQLPEDMTPDQWSHHPTQRSEWELWFGLVKILRQGVWFVCY
jgi:hypothetical protein